MNQNKKSLRVNFLDAVKNYKEKKFKNAEIICFKILSIDSNYTDALILLGTISAVNRNFEKAKEFMQTAYDIDPQNTGVLNNLGTANKELGKIDEAISAYKKVLSINPNHVNANYNLGLTSYQLRDFKSAKTYLQKTVNLQSNYALAFFNLGNVHADIKENQEALSCYLKAIEINPNIVMAYNNLGLLYREMSDYSNAIKFYKKAIALKSNHVNSHHNLALAYKETGNFIKSIEFHENAIKLEPNNLSHYYYLCDLDKKTLSVELKNKIKKILLSKEIGLSNFAYGNYLLAKYENQIKNYENELKYLIKGHKNFFDIHKQKFEANNKYCFEDVNQIITGCKVQKTGTKNEIEINPIFITGLPRTGTTLVERIISSGEKFIPIGEETGVIGNYIPKKILENKSLNLGNVNEVRDDLLSIYKNLALVFKKYDYTFTDKSLDNFFYLELINEIYPNAKIINCRRNALSSIMSIFKNNLISLSWTHNLETIFKYFDNYFSIIENYNEINPNEMYELQFEDLINNPNDESKKLMEFCDLPWDKKCLEFHKRKDQFSKTASNIQIREAIYNNPEDKYSQYKSFLDEYGKKYSWFK